MYSPSLKSILLIDDDQISNLFNRIFLNKLDLNADVDFVLNGAEGIAFLKERAILRDNLSLESCLVLLDLRMPIMDGWQFLEAYENLLAAEAKTNVIIVVLTTSEDEADIVRALKNPNIKEVIKKPLSEAKFEKLIKKFFSGVKEI